MSLNQSLDRIVQTKLDELSVIARHLKEHIDLLVNKVTCDGQNFIEQKEKTSDDYSRINREIDAALTLIMTKSEQVVDLTFERKSSMPTAQRVPDDLSSWDDIRAESNEEALKKCLNLGQSLSYEPIMSLPSTESRLSSLESGYRENALQVQNLSIALNTTLPQLSEIKEQAQRSLLETCQIREALGHTAREVNLMKPEFLADRERVKNLSELVDGIFKEMALMKQDLENEVNEGDEREDGKREKAVAELKTCFETQTQQMHTDLEQLTSMFKALAQVELPALEERVVALEEGYKNEEERKSEEETPSLEAEAPEDSAGSDERATAAAKDPDLTVEEQAQRMNLWSIVERGRDWEDGDNDGGPGGHGVVVEINRECGAVRVLWDCGGETRWYKMGADNWYHLRLIEIHT